MIKEIKKIDYEFNSRIEVEYESGTMRYYFTDTMPETVKRFIDKSVAIAIDDKTTKYTCQCANTSKCENESAAATTAESNSILPVNIEDVKKVLKTDKKMTETKSEIIKAIENYEYIIYLFEAMSKEELADYISYAICRDHTGKMSGIKSLSTCCLVNGRCLKRLTAENDSICSHCFAAAMESKYKGLTLKLIKNTAFLTSRIVPVECWPRLTDKYFRLESFGDLNNEIQALNYINFARVNPDTVFGWWTKNPDIIRAALKKYNVEMPANVNLIYSNPKMNTYVNACTVRKNYPFVDKTFNVWTDETAANNTGICINCGARDCSGCMNCYTKNGITMVHELLK